MFIINPYIFSSGYTITNALWFDGSADYLTFTPGSAGSSRTVFTFSLWFKRSNVTDTMAMLVAGPDANNRNRINFEADETFQYEEVSGGASKAQVITNNLFRDPTAWSHLYVQRNGTNAVTVKLNGGDISTNYNNDPSTDAQWGHTVAHAIGRSSYGAAEFFNGYLAEIMYIDGSAEAIGSFGEYDDNGVWIPVNPSGISSFGDNGFLLQFKENGSGQDANGIGADTSGRNNHFAVGGGSIQNNRVTDTCTDDANNNIGNYATINSLNIDGATLPTISNGGTTFTRNGSSSDNQQAYATQVAVGKKYFEFDITGNSNSIEIGWAAPGESRGNEGAGITSFDVEVYLLGMNAQGGSGPFPLTMHEGQAGGGGGASTNTDLDSSEITTTPRLKFAIDTDAKKYYFGVVHGSHGGWLDTSGNHGQTFNESAPTGTYTSDSQFIPYVFCHAQTGAGTFHFRDADWTDSAPSGFTALNTANLPAPTVTDGSKYFAAVTYTGNSDSENPRNVTGFQDAAGNNITPDWVWIKSRSDGYSHTLWDVVRGFGNGKELLTDASSAEGSQAGGNGNVSGVVPGGFTATESGSDSVYVNEQGKTYVAWMWKAGGAASTTSPAGTTASSTSVADHGGFSIGTYTGASGAQTIGHGLSRKPSWIIVKNRDDGGQTWTVYQEDLSNDGSEFIILNLTDDKTNGAAFNSTAPNTTVFSVGSGAAASNTNGEDYVFYAFAKTPGAIASGMYTGNGSADGPAVTCDDGASGFAPAWLMIKNINDDGTDWRVIDSVRDGGINDGAANAVLNAGRTTVESSASPGTIIDKLATGFKIRGTDGNTNTSSKNYIYLAFAENPFGGDTVAQGKAR